MTCYQKRVGGAAKHMEKIAICCGKNINSYLLGGHFMIVFFFIFNLVFFIMKKLEMLHPSYISPYIYVILKLFGKRAFEVSKM